MADIDVKDAAGVTVPLRKPPPLGRAAATAGVPVALSTEDKAAIDAITAKLSADPATQTTLAAILAKLIAAPATAANQTTELATLASILAKIIAAPSTEAKQDVAITALGTLATQTTAAAILAKLTADPATQTTLAAILAKIIAAPSTEAKQDAAITQETAINAVLGTTAGAAVVTSVAGTIQGYLRGMISLLVSGITVATHAVTQSGTWTVQPGNTANTTAWKTDGSAVTQPSSIADNSHVTFGAKADAKSTATDTTSITAMSVWKQISASVQAIATSAASLVTGTVLAAGSNAIGKLTANSGVVIGAVENNVVATSGGVASTSRLLSAAASTNATSVKASAGRLYKMQGYNASTSVRYLKLYNKASAPTVGSDTPVRTIALPPGSGFDLDWGNLGYYFSTGIAYALTTGSADADTGALTAADLLGLNMDYA